MNTIALIDGDIVAFEIASSSETPVHWGDGLWTLHCFEGPAKAKLVSRVKELAEAVGADRIICCLTDKVNWRNSVLPSYKQNRVGQRKPMLLNLLKEHMQNSFETLIWPNLEADDVLGILATSHDLPGKKVIITKDKDLQTIPGFHYLIHKDELGVFEVNLDAADKWHIAQALAGDTTDGYTGCPGVGIDSAKKIVEEPFVYESYEHIFKSGPRKGESETRYEKVATPDLWLSVKSIYEKAGLTEADALVQARVARILRSGEYNAESGTVNLWSPNND